MPFTITAIQTQGRSDKSQWVKSYKVSYSSNMVDWITYTNGDGLDEVDFTVLIFSGFFVCHINRHRYSLTYICTVVLSLQVFEANDDRDTIVTRKLDPPVKGARMVRIHPQAWAAYISLRFDVLGCIDKGKDAKKAFIYRAIVIYMVIYI